MTDLSGRRLGQYEIVSLLGKGGMAIVYRARQSSMDRDVAIKVITNDLGENPDFVARFEREARLIARLQHPHILPVYDFGREGSLLFLVMRLVEGGSLDQKLRSGPLPAPQAVQMFTQFASALTYAHDQGIVHRDLKPNNILLDQSGNPYLTDFGIAKMMQENTGRLTATGVAMGTPSYMAPEQWRGEGVDARTDIYALGVMLYEMLTGDLPFKGDTPYALMYKHFDVAAPSPRTLQPTLPDAVGGVISKAMSKKPQERYASANLMAQDLSAAFSDTRVNIPKPPTVEDNEPTFVGGPLNMAPSVSAPANTQVAASSPVTAPNVGAPPGSGTPPGANSPSSPAPIATSTPTVARSAGSTGRITLIIAGVVILVLIVGGLLVVSQSGANANASATVVALAFQNATATQASADSLTGTALQSTSDANSTSTKAAGAQQTKQQTQQQTLQQGSQQPTEVANTSTLAETLETLSATPAATVTPLSLRLATYAFRGENLTFHYPASWETRLVQGYGLVMSEKVDDLTFGLKTSDSPITGPPFVVMNIGNSKAFNRPAMAKATTPMEALLAFRNVARLANIETVPGTHFPTVSNAVNRPELGYARIVYMVYLGPDRFAVIALQTPPGLLVQYRDAVSLPLIRSLDYIQTPTPTSSTPESANTAPDTPTGPQPPPPTLPPNAPPGNNRRPPNQGPGNAN